MSFLISEPPNGFLLYLYKKPLNQDLLYKALHVLPPFFFVSDIISFFYSVLVTLTALPFLEPTSYVSSSGHLHLLFPLLGTVFSQISARLLCSNVSFLGMSSLVS